MKTAMREKVVLSWRTSPRVVTLLNGTTFTARYEKGQQKTTTNKHSCKKCKKNRTKKRKNKNMTNDTCKKKVRFVPTSATQDRVVELKKKYARMKKRQSGKSMASSLAKIGLTMGSKAVNSSFGKKLINKSIDDIPNIFKYGVAKIKNNIKKAMNSDIANMLVDKTK